MWHDALWIRKLLKETCEGVTAALIGRHTDVNHFLATKKRGKKSTPPSPNKWLDAQNREIRWQVRLYV